MAVTGRKPKEGQKRNRNAPTHDWTEVEDTPYSGASPDLPELLDPETGADKWHPQTRAWYAVVRKLPHAVLWDGGMWQEVFTTALIHTDVWNGMTVRTPELRLREKALGLTPDARRDLRIKYVPASDTEPDAGDAETVVVQMRRDRRPRSNALAE